MKADKAGRLFVSCMLALSLFLLLDCFVLPAQKSKGVLVNKVSEESSRLRITAFWKEREGRLLTVPPVAYRNIQVNDTLEVSRSWLTHAILKVGVPAKGKSYEWHLGFVFGGALDFLLFIILLNASYLFYFYRKIPNEKTRRELTIFIAIPNALFIFLYFTYQ